MLTPQDILYLGRQLTFWPSLNQLEKDYLLANTRTAHYPKGTPLHWGGNDCIGVLLVKAGAIRVYITSKEGREVTLYRLEAGDICILSASCVLSSIDFDVSVEAETDCDILQLSSSALLHLSAENVYVELFSYKLAAERFSDVMWAMQQILFTSFDKRLAAFLLEESTKSGSPKISMTHEQIAKNLGSAREVVTRMLKYFVNEGIVQLSRGGITILDKKKLSSL